VPYLITSLAAIVVVAGLFGATVAVGIAILWTAFKHAFQFVTGRSFIFTRRMAFILSLTMATVLICAFIFHLYQAIQAGEISTLGGRGRLSPHMVSWSDSRSEFIWSVFVAAMALTSFWAMLASLLFKAAAAPPRAATSLH
jgi:hypothetical protein